MGKWGYKKGPRIRDAAGKRLLAEIVPTPDEEWRPVPGWEEFFSVSSCGRVRRNADGKLIPQSYKGQDGYVGLRLIHGARSYNPLTATIVAAAFLGPKPDGMQIDHKDGIKTNNFASNLEYVTHRVNHKRAVDMELHAWGERHGGAKLNDQKVREIRASKDTERVLAARYGVADTTIHNVRSGHTWAHLTDDNASLYTGLHPICCTCCVELAKIKAGSQDPDTVDPNHEAARPPVGLERGSNAADQTWVARSGEDNPPPPHGSTDLNFSQQSVYDQLIRDGFPKEALDEAIEAAKRSKEGK